MNIIAGKIGMKNKIKASLHWDKHNYSFDVIGIKYKNSSTLLLIEGGK